MKPRSSRCDEALFGPGEGSGEELADRRVCQYGSTMDNHNHEQQPIDVLAAEEFPVGDADAHSHPSGDAPHDVLAADEFAVPAADPVLHEQHLHSHEHDEHGHHFHMHGHSDDHVHNHGQRREAPSHGYGAGAEPLEIPWKLVGVVAGVAAAMLLLFGLRRGRCRG